MSLFVVATPIGNLKDITQRALDVLSSVDLIAAEDTRHSGKLLSVYNIKTPMVSYHDFSNDYEVDNILNLLKEGKDVALISDAGTPLISDPGYRLVRAARINDVSVTPVPGACALTAAISASGLPCERFSFEGFLPSKKNARLNVLNDLVEESRTMVFYEAPRRLPACLLDFIEVFSPQRDVVLAREITKQFETIKLATLQDLYDFVVNDPSQLKGECVLILAGLTRKSKEEVLLSSEVRNIAKLLAEELPPKKAASLTAKITGANKKDVYEWLVL